MYMSEENLSPKAKEALRQIRNIVMHFGKVPSVRQLMTALGYKSPRSAMLLLNDLEATGFLKRKPGRGYQLLKGLESDGMAQTTEVPLVGTASCGPLMIAEENIEAMIPVSVKLARPGGRYFLLQAHGDSMNKADINDGDLVLVKQQSTADNGQKIVALVDDEATIKEFYKKGNVVILKPHSTNRKHQPIILTEEFQIQGVVVVSLPRME